MFGVGPKEHSASETILVPTASGERDFGAFRHMHAERLPAVLGLRERVGERDIGEVVPVGVDVDAVDRVRMERVRVRVRVEDDGGPVSVAGRLERVEIAKIEPLIAERRPETESSEMV